MSKNPKLFVAFLLETTVKIYYRRHSACHLDREMTGKEDSFLERIRCWQCTSKSLPEMSTSMFYCTGSESGVYSIDMAENHLLWQDIRASIQKSQQESLERFMQVQESLEVLRRCPVELERETGPLSLDREQTGAPEQD